MCLFLLRIFKIFIITAVVEMTFQGQDIPSIESTFNALANNLRVTEKRRKGELKYPDKVFNLFFFFFYFLLYYQIYKMLYSDLSF